MHKNQISKVAIQGWQGSFHHFAAGCYYNRPVEVVPCETFHDLFVSLQSGKVDAAIMAIENSLAGSIHENFTLMQKFDFKITGEIYLRIEQNLMALPGQKLSDITEVHSHPMALAQCRQFFDKHHHIKLIESADTALSAKEIADNQIYGRATVGGFMAAALYNLEIMAPSIESHKSNFTRFLILEKKDVSTETPNKASLWFTLPHQTGSLSKVLTMIAFHGINLTKIESLPIVGEKWVYEFYIDVIFEDYETYQQLISSLQPFTKRFKILGEYIEGNEHDPQDITNKQAVQSQLKTEIAC